MLAPTDFKQLGHEGVDDCYRDGRAPQLTIAYKLGLMVEMNDSRSGARCSTTRDTVCRPYG